MKVWSETFAMKAVHGAQGVSAWKTAGLREDSYPKAIVKTQFFQCV